jgi:drug/metabolite transporter (DMT)-like permease
LTTLESHEFLFLNTFFIASFVFLFFLYKILFNDNIFVKLTDKIKKLTILQVIYFMLIAFITVFSSIIFIHMDKYYNTPLINGLLNKIIASILLLCIGIFMFEEKYNYKQICGVILTIIGLYLIMNK